MMEPKMLPGPGRSRVFVMMHDPERHNTAFWLDTNQFCSDGEQIIGQRYIRLTDRGIAFAIPVRGKLEIAAI
jgi:hypothetical protein